MWWPRFTVWGLGAYMMGAVGLVVGFSIMSAPMKSIENLITGLRK